MYDALATVAFNSVPDQYCLVRIWMIFHPWGSTQVPLHCHCRVLQICSWCFLAANYRGLIDTHAGSHVGVRDKHDDMAPLPAKRYHYKSMIGEDMIEKHRKRRLIEDLETSQRVRNVKKKKVVNSVWIDSWCRVEVVYSDELLVQDVSCRGCLEVFAACVQVVVRYLNVVDVKSHIIVTVWVCWWVISLVDCGYVQCAQYGCCFVMQILWIYDSYFRNGLVKGLGQNWYVGQVCCLLSILSTRCLQVCCLH